MTCMQRFAKRVFDLGGVLTCEMVKDAYHPLIVPIRRNLTGNALQNAFCSRSTRVLVPFCIRSVSVPYPFHTRSISVVYLSRSVLFPFSQCSIGSVLGTRSEKWGFQELVYMNASTLSLNFRLFCVCMNTNNKLMFMWWKCESSYLKNMVRGL